MLVWIPAYVAQPHPEALVAWFDERGTQHEGVGAEMPRDASMWRLR